MEHSSAHARLVSTGHARLSPSKAGQWVACPGSVAMQAAFPDRSSSESAEEGNAVHWMSAEVLSGRGPGEWIGRTAPNGVVITADMKDAGITYVSAIKSMVPELAQLQVEQMVAIPQVHAECFGTPDCYYFNPITMTLYIWDLKYGFGVVEAFENWQLIAYACGQLMGYDRVDFSKVKVVLTIVQPRAYHVQGPVRSWHLTTRELTPYRDRLQAAAALALSPTATCQAGEQCHYCSARHACKAAQQAAYFAIDYIGQAVPEVLSPEALAMELRTLRRMQDAIKFRLTGIEASATATMNAGGHIPGWSLQASTGRLGWDKPAADVFMLGDLMGIDLRAPVAPITPTQAKKAGIPADVLSAYSSAGKGAMQLVPTTDTLAARIFGGQL